MRSFALTLKKTLLKKAAILNDHKAEVLRAASPSLKDDEAMIRFACQHNPFNIRYASDRLKEQNLLLWSLLNSMERSFFG